MTVLVLNCGSSSVKYEVFTDPGNGPSLLDRLHSTAHGSVEGIGEPTGRITTVVVDRGDPGGRGDHARGGADSGAGEQQDERHVEDHGEALAAITDHLEDMGLLGDLRVVGHRVVHGGEQFTQPTLLDDDAIATLEGLSDLAPLHNPPALEGIRVARELRPDLPHVAVFDTSFHATLEPEAYRYAVPQEWYVDHGVRRYGFHGTSHAYVTRQAGIALGCPDSQLKLITLHLGNGASACAVDHGRSIDTSMGLSPLEGLVMGTRSGDLDPTVAFHMMRAGMSPEEVESALNRQSGLQGLAGRNDLRAVQEQAGSEGAEADAATLAVDVMTRRLRKYIGAYLAVLGGLDAVVFTGGIGEHSAAVRSAVIGPLGHLGLVLDEEANRRPQSDDGTRTISTGPVAVLVIPTDEERVIAADALRLVG